MQGDDGKCFSGLNQSRHPHNLCSSYASVLLGESIQRWQSIGFHSVNKAGRPVY